MVVNLKTLVKIIAYIEKVFAVQYQTDEVTFIVEYLQLFAGDVRDVPDRQPGRDDGPLHGHVLRQPRGNYLLCGSLSCFSSFPDQALKECLEFESINLLNTKPR